MPDSALRACKKFSKCSLREQIEHAVIRELAEFTARWRVADTKEAITAFFETRPPDFTGTKNARDTEHVP